MWPRDVREAIILQPVSAMPALHDRQPEKIKTINYLLQSPQAGREVSCGHRGAGKAAEVMADGSSFRTVRRSPRSRAAFLSRRLPDRKRKGKAGSGGSDLKDTAVCAKVSLTVAEAPSTAEYSRFQPPCLSGR